jgi:hypothetical protein
VHCAVLAEPLPALVKQGFGNVEHRVVGTPRRELRPGGIQKGTGGFDGTVRLV